MDSLQFIRDDLKLPPKERKVWDFGLITTSSGEERPVYVLKNDSFLTKIFFIIKKIFGRIDCFNLSWRLFILDHDIKKESEDTKRITDEISKLKTDTDNLIKDLMKTISALEDRHQRVLEGINLANAELERLDDLEDQITEGSVETIED